MQSMVKIVSRRKQEKKIIPKNVTREDFLESVKKGVKKSFFYALDFPSCDEICECIKSAVYAATMEK